MFEPTIDDRIPRRLHANDKDRWELRCEERYERLLSIIREFTTEEKRCEKKRQVIPKARWCARSVIYKDIVSGLQPPMNDRIEEPAEIDDEKMWRSESIFVEFKINHPLEYEDNNSWSLNIVEQLKV